MADELFSPIAPMSSAPPDYAAQFAAPEPPSPAEQYYTGVQFDAPTTPAAAQQSVSPESVAAALEFQVRYQGYQPTMGDIQALAPQDRDRIARLAQMQAPVYHPGTASRPEATLPTTSSVVTEAPANYDEQRNRIDQTYLSGANALTSKALTQKEILEGQLLRARDERAQLERKVQAEQQYQDSIRSQQQAAFQRAKRMRDEVASKRVDPARVFKAVPAVGIAAAFADAMYALGGAGPQHTMRDLIERDTALQMAEIEKLGADADNALAMVAREFDGDLAQAQAAINVTKADIAKREATTMAAEIGLQELPAAMQQEIAQLDQWALEQERLLGESAKTRAQQNYQYQAAQQGSAGYYSAPTLKEQGERAGAIATIDKALPAGAEQVSVRDELRREERVTKYGEKMTALVKARASADRVDQTISGYEAANQGIFTTVPGVGWLNYFPAQEGRKVLAEVNAALSDYGRAQSGATLTEQERADLRMIVRGRGTLEDLKHGMSIIRDKIDAEERATQAQYTAEERATYTARKGAVEAQANAQQQEGAPR